MSVLSMFGRAQLHPILFLAVTCTVAADVKQMIVKDDIITGQTATFHCYFPLFRDINKIAVHWWKDDEREFLNSRQDPRRSFKVESKASAMLILRDVRFGDAGVYYCRVEGEYIGNGTGVKLNVKASPEPLKILPELFGNGSLKCLCKTSGFYPADYHIVWRKGDQIVTTGVRTVSEKNAEGLYEVSSYLEETQPVQIGTVYICEVSHSTLRVPTRVNYTVSIADGASFSASFPWWIYLCGAVALLLLIIATVLCCKFCKCKRKAHEDNIQMRHCVRCSDPKTANRKGKEEGAKKGNTQTPPRNPSRVAKVDDTAPKVKKHHKRDRDPSVPDSRGKTNLKSVL